MGLFESQAATELHPQQGSANGQKHGREQEHQNTRHLLGARSRRAKDEGQRQVQPQDPRGWLEQSETGQAGRGDQQCVRFAAVRVAQKPDHAAQDQQRA